MNKTILKKEKNQVCEELSLKSLMYRATDHLEKSAAIALASGEIDSDRLYDSIEEMRNNSPKELPIKLIRLILHMSLVAKRKINPSQTWIAKKIGCSKNYVTELLHIVCGAGIVIKNNQGQLRTCEYTLNPIFNDPAYQEILYMLYKGLRIFSLGILCSFPTLSHTMLPTFKKPMVGLPTADLYLLRRLYIYNKNIVRERDAYRSLTHTKKSDIGPPRDMTGQELPPKSRVSSMLEKAAAIYLAPEIAYWSRGERMSRELMMVMGTESERRPCFASADAAPLQAAPISKKVVANEVFGCLETTVQATSDSFDNSNEGEWYMKRVPYLEDGGDWEEVYDPPVDTQQLYAEPAPREPKAPSRAPLEEPELVEPELVEPELQPVEQQFVEPPSKYSYYPRLDGFVLLRATPFGKMKLSLIPESVLISCYNHFLKQKPEQQSLDYHRFFEFCVQKCKEVPIPLGPRWRRFFDACQERGIDAKKEPCVYAKRQPEYIAPQREEEDPEDGFWTCEKHTLSEKYAKAVALIGHLPNPYRKHLEEHPPTQHPQLFKLYQAAHVDGQPQPGDALERYRRALKAFKDAQSSSFP